MQGVYFADIVSKSAGYCATSREAPTACMLLCDVALGGMNEKLHADYNANQLPKGKLSTKGIGRVEPNSKQWQKLDDGCVVPCGAPVDQSTHPHPSLQYNGHPAALLHTDTQLSTKSQCPPTSHLTMFSLHCR